MEGRVLMDIAALYKPSLWGEKYHALPHDEALGGGAAGPGKTQVLIAEPFAQIAVEHERMTKKGHPHRIEKGDSTGQALYIRRTFPMVEDTINRARKIYEKLDPGCKFDGVRHTFTFTSGYKVRFGHCKDPNDWEIYQGNEYSMLLCDELTQLLKEQYMQLKSRVRSSDPVLCQMLKIRNMSNPNMDRKGMEGVKVDEDPYWVRKRFVDSWPMGERTLVENIKLKSGKIVRKTRIFLPAKLSDNPDPQFAERYEADLMTLPLHIRQALLEGDWYTSVGAFFSDDWRKDLHIVKPFKIPKDWLRFRSMDWGFKAPGCVGWWAMDPDGNLFCEYEFYFKGMTATQVAERIRDREKEYGLYKHKRSLITGPADTQLWEKRGSSAMSMAEEMAKVGIRWTKADKTSRARNAGLLSKRLRDHQNETRQPGIVFFENCKKCISTIPNIQASPGDPEMPADGGDDHALDMVMYACAHASRGRAGISMQRAETELDDKEDDAPVGQYGYGVNY